MPTVTDSKDRRSYDIMYRDWPGCSETDVPTHRSTVGNGTQPISLLTTHHSSVLSISIAAPYLHATPSIPGTNIAALVARPSTADKYHWLAGSVIRSPLLLTPRQLTMSSPFVYRPPTIPVAYDAPSFQRTPYTYTPRPSTPFVPDYPSSPYSRPPSLNASPNRGAVPLPRADIPERYAFPAARSGYQAGYDDLWEPRRERWQSPWVTPPPFSAPYSVSSAPAGVPSYPPPRRHSFSSARPPPLQLHPLLNAESPIPTFFFDLSPPDPEPLLYYRGNQMSTVSAEDLAQPATFPPTTRLRIVSDTLPQEWEIELGLSSEMSEYYVRAGYDPPPITVQDVLLAVHQYMQLPITHSDWARLSRAEIENVRRAFTRRCKTAPGGREGYEAERAKGVRRVDYLSGSTRLLGLLKMGREDGCETVKMVTTDPFQPT